MENWYNCSDAEIIQHLLDRWNIRSLRLIGKYEKIENQDFGYFRDCRSLEFELLDQNDILSANERTGKINNNVSAFAYHQEGWQTGKVYIIETELASLKQRKLKENPFLLRVKVEKPVELLKPEVFIQQRYQLYADAPTKLTKQLAKAVKTITAEINKKPETFIYELLQNADDFPVELRDADGKLKAQKVRVKFELTDKFLVLTHDGLPFDFQNVDALCGINEGDKRYRSNTIGFKG
ncbi:MAG: hypothetical protein KKG00_12335, partial [Bacteroidetes bacterium]|nr:hypothetical protein [Bacteroidota bacterium]